MAYVLGPDWFEYFPVPEDWPEFIDCQGWRFWPDLGVDLTPQVRWVPDDQRECVVYRLRAWLLDEEGLTTVPAIEPAAERTSRRGRTPDLTRQDSAGDRGAPRGSYRRRQSAAQR
jgi:hypothetical protein